MKPSFTNNAKRGFETSSPITQHSRFPHQQLLLTKLNITIESEYNELLIKYKRLPVTLIEHQEH